MERLGRDRGSSRALRQVIDRDQDPDPNPHRSPRLDTGARTRARVAGLSGGTSGCVGVWHAIGWMGLRLDFPLWLRGGVEIPYRWHLLSKSPVLGKPSSLIGWAWG